MCLPLSDTASVYITLHPPTSATWPPSHPAQAAENVRALMDALPPMRPLVMVLKVFLQQRELNEVRLAAPLAPQLVLRESRGCSLALRPPYLLLLLLFCLPSPVILCPLLCRWQHETYCVVTYFMGPFCAGVLWRLGQLRAAGHGGFLHSAAPIPPAARWLPGFGSAVWAVLLHLLAA